MRLNSFAERMAMVRAATAAGAVCLLMALGTGAATAQQEHASERRPMRVPVTIVLMDTTAQVPGYRILRRADEAPYDVILLRGRADAVTLSDAVSDLLLVRMAQGDTATSTAPVRVRRARADAGAQRVPRFPWAERVVNDLWRAEPREVQGIGTVRAVEIWLPPQHGRGAPPLGPGRG
jgi:hypothetical protein